MPSDRPRTLGRRLAVALVLAACTTPLVGQAPPSGQLKLSPGPYYADVPITIELHVEGLERAPQPTVDHEPLPDGQTLTGPSFSPSSFQSMRIDERGRRVVQSRTTWMIRYQFLVAEPGRVRTPDFTVTQDGKSVRIRGAQISLATIPLSDRVGVEVVLPDRPIYPGQRIPIEIRMQFESGLGDEIVDYSLRVPFGSFGQSFSFIDEEFGRADKALRVETGTGVVELKREGQIGKGPNGTWTWLVARRTLVPLRPGTYELPASSLLAVRGLRWRRTVFGREATEKEILLGKDIPRTITVRTLPATGKPASFSGAVGRGFAIEVEADRSVVRTGDPITLTFTLRGDGNLQAAGLPDLVAAGLPEDGFIYTARPVPGIYEDGAKRFTVTVSPKDPSVNAIPPLEYAWFDPDAEVYRTTTTEPIALAVERGETVGAEGVVGGPSTSESGDVEIIPRPSSDRPRFVLDGADLSLEKDPAALAIVERDRFGGAAARTGLLALGVLLVIAALGTRLRDRTPPEVRERRARLAGLAREVARTSGDPSPESLKTMVGTLRTMAREVRLGSGVTVDGLEEFLRTCEDRIYAPGATEGAGDDPGTRAREFAKKLEEAGR